MTIKIVTDSTCDLPDNIIQDLDITVVAEYLRFGDQVYRDHIDISEDEFYKKLLNENIYPHTAQPTPQDFEKVYQKLSQTADSIISIHLSSKLSGTYQSAEQGKQNITKKCPIDTIDSQMVSIALGLIVIQAAKMAKSGLSHQKIIGELGKIIPNTHFLMLFDTMKYLAKGGRIDKSKALIGSVLRVKPLLTIKNGLVASSSLARTRQKGIETLVEFVKKSRNIQDLGVVYSTTPDDAKELISRTSAVFPEDRTILARLGPALGVHGGPGVLAVALREQTV
jgi:DegV family protein with EDD domain